LRGDTVRLDGLVFERRTREIAPGRYEPPSEIVRLNNIPANERPVFMTMSGVYVPEAINSVVSDTCNRKRDIQSKRDESDRLLYAIRDWKIGYLGCARDQIVTRD
jgi:hypothetical protein